MQQKSAAEESQLMLLTGKGDWKLDQQVI